MASGEIRLLPDTHQEDALLDLLTYVAHLWNEGIEAKRAHFADTGEALRYTEVWKRVGKQPHPLRSKVSSVAAQQVLRLLDRMHFRAVVGKGKAKFPQPVEPGGVQPSFIGNWLTYSEAAKCIYLPKIGRVKYEGVLTGKVRRIRIDYRDRAWYAHCTLDEDAVVFDRPPQRPARSVRIPPDMREAASRFAQEGMLDQSLIDSATTEDGLEALARAFAALLAPARARLAGKPALTRALEQAEQIIKPREPLGEAVDFRRRA